MPKAEITLKIAIDTDLGVVNHDIKTLVDGNLICNEEQGITVQNLAEIDTENHYAATLRYQPQGPPVTSPIPFAYAHDLLMKALKPITSDKRFGF